MDNISKFKWITVGCIALFIFIVAAFYSNAKDIATQKQKEEQQKQIKDLKSSDKPQALSPEEVDSAVAIRRVEELSDQVSNLERKIEDLSDKGSDTKCSIKGILVDGNIMELTGEDAFNEAKQNNRTLVLTCKL